MSVFQNQTASTAIADLDPNKHVKFSLGMVLGADDLEQEFAYVSNLPQWLARETIGYGTVCGLKVSLDSDSHGPRISVEPGVAVTPRGQLVRVKPAQCAHINNWLTMNREEVIRQTGSPLADRLLLYVVLCYRACPTDTIPIPGEPCRDETESTVESRWQDDFDLKLSFTPPEQTEEDAVRSFVAWLSQIPITDEPTSFADLNEFLDILRSAAPMLEMPWGSPPELTFGSPLGTHHINTADACEYLRAAFRVWVTELRPRWRGYLHYTVREGDRLATIAARFNTSEDDIAILNQVSDASLLPGMALKIPKMFCDGTQPDEECLLLAELDVPLIDGQADATMMSRDNIHEERRPYLIHLRLLQEWLLCGRTAASALSISALSGDAEGPSEANTVVKIQHWPVSPDKPDENQVLTYLGGQWQPADLPSITVPDLAGDVTGPASANTVVKIQNVDVAAGTPGNGQVLTYDQALGKWTAQDPTGGPVTGDFVEHPTGLPRYFIVAAGIVRGDGTNQPQFAPYNGLVATDEGNSQLLVNFNGYADPDGSFVYIVKAMPVFNDKFRSINVAFLHFGGGIHLLVTDTGQRLQSLTDIQLMIEISLYGSKQGFQPALSAGFAAGRQPLNLNTATADELLTLPGIDTAIANRIVQLRKKRRGGFKSLRDLLKVEGIGEDVLQAIEPLVTISR